MLGIPDIVTMARAEIAATFRGRKGVLLALMLVLLAAVPSLARLLGAHSAAAEQLQRAHLAALVKIYDVDIARSLADCPPILVVMALATFFFQPLFVLVAGADRVASDIDSGAIRFWTVRVSRVSVVLGKALGLWATVVLLTVGVQWAMAIIAVVDNPHDWVWTLRWAGAIMVFSSASALVYASLCTFLGVLVARPRLVFGLGTAAVFALRILRSVLREHHTETLASLLPGALDQLFLTAGAATKLVATGVILGWSALFLTGAAVVFSRRSV